MERLKRFILPSAAVICLVIIGLQSWFMYKLRNRVKEAEWQNALTDKGQDDVFTTDVGTIQFLKHGYSIELESANYNSEGLSLKGHIGNPNLININNLTLKFAATLPLYKYEEQFHKDRFGFMFGPESIGEAQSTPISSLMAGHRQPFEVTIPNAKQTAEGIRLVVSFTGERYSYSL